MWVGKEESTMKVLVIHPSTQGATMESCFYYYCWKFWRCRWVLLGDAAHPPLLWLMNPYPETTQTTATQFAFRCCLSRTGMDVGRAIGLLKGRWPCWINIWLIHHQHQLNYHSWRTMRNAMKELEMRGRRRQAQWQTQQEMSCLFIFQIFQIILFSKRLIITCYAKAEFVFMWPFF